MRGKNRLSLSKEAEVPKYKDYLKRPLYVLVKQDNFITLRVNRLPNLLRNLNLVIFVCKEVDICDIDIYFYLLIFIPPWYF